MRFQCFLAVTDNCKLLKIWSYKSTWQLGDDKWPDFSFNRRYHELAFFIVKMMVVSFRRKILVTIYCSKVIGYLWLAMFLYIHFLCCSMPSEAESGVKSRIQLLQLIIIKIIVTRKFLVQLA